MLLKMRKIGFTKRVKKKHDIKKIRQEKDILEYEIVDFTIEDYMQLHHFYFYKAANIKLAID